MKAIIMAGGFGTRLRPLTINVPKPMSPIGNLPMMEHVVSLLSRHGITDITALLYFQPDSIKNYFGDGSQFGVQLSYAQPDQDYGTAGAVRFALESVREPILIISGDLVTDFNLSEAMEWHKQRNSEATLLLTHMENPLPYGIVITDGEGRISRFLEKPSWGEAFSDTINTGIYLLEPSAINLIPPKTNFDFSQNLFPLMLARKMGLYGKIMDGYWKDVGNIEEYRRAHIDLFESNIQLDLKCRVENLPTGELLRAENAEIGENVTISGRVIVGWNANIESNVKLSNCVIGNGTRVEAGCELTNSVIWQNGVIGKDSRMLGAVICNNVRLGNNVQLNDNVIISDDCLVGDAVTVRANCKIWPGKKIDPGSIVSSSMVWGEKWNRELFTYSKITGLGLTEITPEMAVKVGAAFGASFGHGIAVLTSRDASDTSRLLKRALVSGLLASGVNVSDLENMPIPVMRYGLRHGDFAAGIYIRHNPDDFREIDIIFFDGSGVDMPTSKLKKVERLYFSEDFERSSLDTIGHLDMPRRPLEEYRIDFLKAINADVIRKRGFKVVVDHSNGSSSEIFPTVYSRLGIEAIQLNASLDPRKFSSSPEEQALAIRQLSAIVTSLKGDIGLLFNSAAEKLTVVDERGNPVDSQTLLLVMLELYLKTNAVRKIAVTVDASMGVEEIAARYNVEVVRVANDHLAMMEINRRGEVDFVGGTRGGFIMPGFQMGADAMLAGVKLLELLAMTGMGIGEVADKYSHLVRQMVSVPCPWSKKGTVMRKLITGTENKQRQLIDGVRVFENDGWVLVIPDLRTAAFKVLAESKSAEHTEELIDRYRTQVEEFQLG